VRVRRALLEELSGAPAGLHARSHERLLARSMVRRVSPQARPAALIGSVGASGVRPGEFSLAHGGLLLADEFPEWSRDSRELLREPLERGQVLLTRARGSIELPARFRLAANGNLCPCGGWPPHLPMPAIATDAASPGGSALAPPITRCQCPSSAIQRYLSRLSGPVLDRLDLVALITAPGERQRADGDGGTDSIGARLARLREQVERSQERAIRAWGSVAGRLESAELERVLAANAEWRARLDPARFPSLRTRHKILRVALSLAAWDGLPEPTGASFAEAECYRPERLGLR
jgi:magnesium chelatase family protein